MGRFEPMESFARVATLGSFSSAAKQLGTSHALLSQHVTNLEKRLGVRLLNSNNPFLMRLCDSSLHGCCTSATLFGREK